MAQEAADDLFLRLGSQPFFRATLQDAAGHTAGMPSAAGGEAADDLLLRVGDQPLFRTTLIKSGGATPAPVLAALTLSTTAATAGVAFTATIAGRTAGSKVTATASDGTVLTVTGSTLTGTFAGAGTPTLSLAETLLGATGSPRVTAVAVTVAAAASGSTGASADLSDANRSMNPLI